MYFLGQSYKKFSFVLVCISLILVSYCISAESDEEIFKSRPKQKANAKQFPNLSFVGLNLIQSRSNIFGRSTTTRTILSTVATITAASFRTCTTSAAALTPCAGRRRRDLSGENELDGEHDNDMMTRVRQDIEPTPSIKLIIDKTEITDPASVAEILNEKPLVNNYQITQDENLETTTINSQVLLERNLDGTTTELYPSQDATSSSVLNDDVTSVNDIIVDDDAVSGTTVETPYSDSIDTTLDSLNVDDDKARIGVGQGGVVTVTSMIPITHVVQTAATGTSATLTVMYAGCLPPSLPVYGQQCTM